jgi:hypothetical protein
MEIVYKASDSPPTIASRGIADKLASYLRHDISIANLVSWAENAMMDDDLTRMKRLRLPCSLRKIQS